MTTSSPFVVATTTLPFHLSWSVTGFVEVTRQSSLMEQELLTGSHELTYGFLWGPGWSIFSVLCYVLCILVCFIIPSLFVIVLSVIILLTASAYSLAIFRIFRYAWVKISRFYQRSLSFLKFVSDIRIKPDSNTDWKKCRTDNKIIIQIEKMAGRTNNLTLQYITKECVIPALIIWTWYHSVQYRPVNIQVRQHMLI